MRFLTTTRAIVLSILLAAQALTFYALPKAEYVPTAKPLDQLPASFGTWRLISQSRPEPEIQDLLRADDALTRIYGEAGGDQVSLFVAFFKSQRAGVQPHSPKVCLPGSGWTPSTSEYLDVAIPGRAEPITVNRYLVTRGDATSVVLYWYQTPTRVVANEFAAKFYLVLDSIRYQRSDTALVRVIMPAGPDGVERAKQQTIRFVQTSFEPVRNHLPL